MVVGQVACSSRGLRDNDQEEAICYDYYRDPQVATYTVYKLTENPTFNISISPINNPSIFFFFFFPLLIQKTLNDIKNLTKKCN